MPPQYFIRGIAFDALRPGVPAGDDPVGIEKEDRVIDDRLNQQLETALDG
jgi:hypothetical protein